MDLHRHPGLVDRLAGEYALGVLRGAARRRLEHIATRDRQVRIAIEAWQARMHALAELGPGVAPPSSVWGAIERRLELSARQAQQPDAHAAAAKAVPFATQVPPPARKALAARWFDSLSFWRGWSIAATAVAVLALVVALRPFEAPVPSPAATGVQVAEQPNGPAAKRVAYMAALKDSHSDETMMLVMWDERNAMMTVHRMAGGAQPAGKSEQLWGMQENGHPVSLGLIPPGGMINMKVHGMNAYLKLAVSMEPEGGSPDPTGPTGPILCAGKLMPTT